MDFFNHLLSYLPSEDAKLLVDSFKEHQKHGVLLNTLKMSDEKFLSLFPNVHPHPCVKHAFIYNPDEYPLSKSIYYELGAFYLQEPSAMVPPSLLSLQQSDIILDLCSAPGGKTIHSSFIKSNQGVVVANDISYERCLKTIENIEKLGIGNVIVTCSNFAKIYESFIDCFDKIILDAPCSGSGMFRKNQKFVDDWSYNKVLKYQKEQKELITIAYKMLKPGGLLMYSTCSYSQEENEDVIQFLLENSDAILAYMPSHEYFYQNKKRPIGVHLFPYLFPGEGHYLCLIEKPSSNIANKKRIFQPPRFENKLFKLLPFSTTYTCLEQIGDYLYLFPKHFDTKKLNVLYKGVKIGKIINNQITKFDFHCSRFIDNFPRVIDLSLLEAEQYINNHPITTNSEKNIYWLRYDKLGLSLAKSDGKWLKNCYPKITYPKKYN